MNIINIDGKKYFSEIDASEVLPLVTHKIDGKLFTKLDYAIHYYLINYINPFNAKLNLNALKLPTFLFKECFEKRMNNKDFWNYVKRIKYIPVWM